MAEYPCAVDEFAAALAATAAERGVFGARLLYAAEVGSTNDLAAAAAERGEPEGTTFVAGAQTAGRGRLGRTWFSPPGAGLYLSTIVRRASLAPWITLAGGVAVADGIRAATGLPLQIKWPNDIVAVGGAGFPRAAEDCRHPRRGLVRARGRATRRPRHRHQPAARGVSAGARRSRRRRSRPSSDAPSIAGPVLAQVLAALNRTLADSQRPVRRARRAMARAAPSAHGAPIEWDGPSGAAAGVDGRAR